MTELNVRKMPDNAIEQRRQKRRKKRIRRRIVIITLLIIGAMIGLLFTPLFNLSSVVITGNEKITNEEIMTAGQISVGKNIFMLNLNNIGNTLSEIPYVNSIHIKRDLPDKLVINLTECIPMSYITTESGYAVIDKDGKILEITPDHNIYKIPLLLDFSSTVNTPGGKILVEDEEKFKKTLAILRDLYNNNFIDRIESVGMSENIIKLKITDRLVIDMGEYEQFNAKIVTVKEVVSKLPENDYGTLTVVSPDKVYHNHTMPEGGSYTEEEKAKMEATEEVTPVIPSKSAGPDETIYQ